MANLLKKKEEKELSPLEKREEAVHKVEEDIDKDFAKKMFVVRYARPIATIFVVGILVILFALSTRNSFEFYRNLIPERSSEPVEVVDLPPDDFEITAESPSIVRNADGDLVDVFFRLANSDAEWGVSELDYTVKVRGADDQVVGEKSGSTYILPGTTRSLVEVNIAIASAPKSVEISLNPVKVQKLRDYGEIDLRVLDARYFERLERGRVEGTIRNDSPFAFEKVDLNIVVFDSGQNIVALNKTNVNALVASQERDFVATWADYDSSAVQVVVEPQIDVYSSSTFINQYGDSQELSY